MGVLSAVINITKSSKNAIMETNYFTELFYLKTDEFCIQELS